MVKGVVVSSDKVKEIVALNLLRHPSQTFRDHYQFRTKRLDRFHGMLDYLMRLSMRVVWMNVWLVKWFHSCFSKRRDIGGCCWS